MVSLSKIDAVEEYISSLIQNKQENEFVDFKQFYYHEDKKYDLIKDIVSFSNEVKQNNQTTTSNFPCNFNFAVSNMNRFNQGIYHG